MTIICDTQACSPNNEQYSIDNNFNLFYSQMLDYGCTRLEIGVQSVFEDVACDTNRGHTVKAVCESFQLAKDSGFKVVAHMMPDLPNVGFERDVEGFKVSLM